RDTSDPADRGDKSGSGKDDTKTAEIDEEKKAQCDAIAAKVPASCDLKNPPVFAPNGCGREGDPGLDFLLMDGLPVPFLGPIFRGACDNHDRCYSTYPGDKKSCDMKLETDMVAFVQEELSDRQWKLFGPLVRLQALAFSSGFQAPFIDSISQGAFDAGQSKGMCRFYSKKAIKTGCFD